MISRKNSAPGFSLVELLVSLTIVAVLVAILVPTVSSVMERGRTMNCQSNLRQIGSAALIWSAENNGWVAPTLIRPGGDANALQWNKDLLIGYLGIPDDGTPEVKTQIKKKISCPEWYDPQTTFWDWGYAINDTPGYEGTRTTKRQKQTNRIVYDDDGTKKGNFGPWTMQEITHPTSRLFFFDANEWQLNPNRILEEGMVDVQRHHNGFINGVFFDGHVEAITLEEAYRAVYDPGNRSLPTPDV